MEMPPLTLMVLDALADDFESVATMRDHGEASPMGLDLVDEPSVIDATRKLLSDGLVEAWEPTRAGLVLVASPRQDAVSIRRYLFRPTAAGRQAWAKAEELLEAYWDSQPLDDH